jgi:hypothetical protein
VASTDFRGSAFNDHFRTFLDDKIALKSLFLFVLSWRSGRPWTSPEVTGKVGMVGRLATENEV